MDAGEIEDGDLEVAYALMGIGELIGMRWILWNEAGEIPEHVVDELMRFISAGWGRGEARRPGRHRRLPAGQVDDRLGDLDASGIPEEMLVERFWPAGQHIAAPDEHVSDMAVSAGELC